MTIFDFLAVLSKEKYSYKIEHIEWSNSLKVTVDTFSKIEIYEFNEGGVTQYTELLEASNTENKKTIFDKIQDLENRSSRMWAEAAVDLGIAFISPHKFTGVNGEEYEVDGLLPEFGFGKGVLITSRHTNEEAVFMAEQSNEYMMTSLSPRYYETYNRQHIVETLSEWGWIGQGNKPEWVLI